MNDTISRREAIETLRMDIDIIPFAKAREYVRAAIETIYNRLEELPSAETEIIRCKDCKWYGRADKRRFYRGMDCLQKRIDTIIPDKDFCSRAERREE